MPCVGGDKGFREDGSHAEYITVAVTDVREKPKNLSFEQSAAVGVCDDRRATAHRDRILR